MKRQEIIVGARGSLLSTVQTAMVIRDLKKAAPQYKFIFRRITTLGDRVKEWKRSDTGIFVKELEEGLLKNEIDLAVHSVKDLPSVLHSGLSLEAVIKRAEPRDALITREKNQGIRGLKRGAVIGTTSLRRKAQVLKLRPDIEVKDLRGNLDTRIRKLNDGLYDAIIVAAAGVKRLKYGKIKLSILKESQMLPAAGQGALGIEVRKGDKRIIRLVKKINDPRSRICVESERLFLRYTRAGCRMPVAAFAAVIGKRISMEGMLISLDGKKEVRLSCEGKISRAADLARSLAKRVLYNGGKEILREIENG